VSRNRKEERVIVPAPADLSKPTIIASVIIGFSILVGSWLIHASLDRTAEEVSGLRASLSDTGKALQAVAAANAQPAQAQQRRRGPDPNKRYTINTAGAPARGKASAKITLVAFSDFQ
jgi:hypothetical protein